MFGQAGLESLTHLREARAEIAAAMSDKFDPYYRWLGIPSKEQPPNYYRLLGVELYESDPQLIDSFALRHASYLREITDGPHLQDAQRLLNELAAARRCLLNPQRKAAYDAELRERMAAEIRPSDGDAAKRAPAPEPAADAADVSREVRSPGAVPPILIAPRNEPGPSAAGRGSRRAKLSAAGALSDADARRPRGPAGKVTSRAFSAHAMHAVSCWAGACANGAGKRPLWRLATGVAVTLIVIAAGAVILFRGKPPRPAVATAAARQGSERTPSAAPAAEQKSLAASLQEPPSDPALGEPPGAASLARPEDEPVVTVPASTKAAIQTLPSQFIPDGQPPRLAGLALWLDASQLTAAEGRIARWSDAGGGSYVARPKRQSEQPEVLAQALGGKNVARFRGGQRLEIPRTSLALNLGSDYTIVHVARGVAGTLLSKGIGDKAGQFSLQSNSCLQTNGELNVSSGGRLSAADDDPARFRVRTIVADATALNWFLDGTAGGSYSGERYEIQNTAVLWIGSPWFRAGQEDLSQFFVGDLAELVIYSRALPEEERVSLETYLREKWLAADQAPAPLDLVGPPAVPSGGENVATAVTTEDSGEPAAAPPGDTALAETGQIHREVWHNFYGIDLGAVHELWSLRPEPDLSETTDRFEAPEDFGDNYCQRFRGYLQPPATGEYLFSVRANEDGVLFVSTDERPENKRQVTAKDKILLAAGRAYYVEAIHWEKGGKDYFSVGWKLPGGKKEEHPIPGRRLSLRDRPIPPHDVGFVALTPARAEASEGSQLQIMDDGFVLADGATTENEVYRLACEISMPAITALQLHAVPHESLPGSGPGFGLGGSFRLAEVQVSVAEANPDEVPRTAKFREVVSRDGDSGMVRLIDGNPATVWSCRRGGQGVLLTLLLAEPIRASGEAVLNVTLLNRENLGCFRLLATAAPEPRTLAAAAREPSAPALPEPSDLFRLFVNLGGGSWQDPAGNSWQASKKFDGATFGHEAGQAIKSDLDHPVYSTAVRGLNGFRAVVPNGDYAVELHFQEHWAKDPADRAFVVLVEQIPVVRPPRYFQGPGMGQPYVHTIGKVSVQDERLDVDFSPLQPGSLSILNGIVIRQLR